MCRLARSILVRTASGPARWASTRAKRVTLASPRTCMSNRLGHSAKHLVRFSVAGLRMLRVNGQAKDCDPPRPAEQFRRRHSRRIPVRGRYIVGKVQCAPTVVQKAFEGHACNAGSSTLSPDGVRRLSTTVYQGQPDAVFRSPTHHWFDKLRHGTEKKYVGDGHQREGSRAASEALLSSKQRSRPIPPPATTFVSRY